MKARLVAAFVVWMMLGSLIPVRSVDAQDDGTIKGTIDSATPFVRVPITVTEEGSTITADIKPVSGDLDTVLYLLDNQDQIIAENDDRAKDDPSSLLVFPLADAGQYTLIATRYKVAEGDSSGDFELKIDQAKGSPAPGYRVSAEDIAAAGFPSPAPLPQRAWTILVYYGGDNNLEPGILNDLDEFEVGGGSDSTTNIIALVDRNPGFTDTNDNWTTVRLFDLGTDVTKDHDLVFPPTIDTPPLADLGELDTGDGETLAQFLVWGIRHFPAEHYIVAFGDHGAGWQGLVIDDTSDRAILSIPELQQALALALAEAGLDKFDLLVNDACLMSSVEYFAALSPFFHYSLASPEIVIDPALDMTELTGAIEAGSTAPVNLDEIGKALVNTYVTRDILKRDSSDVAYLTHALTNLDRFDPVVEAVDKFARIVNNSPAVYSTLLGDARANTYVYSSFIGEKAKIDLGSFMNRVAALSTNSQLISAAQEVQRTLNEALIYKDAGDKVKGRISYYNLYFPDSSKDFKQEYFEQSPLKSWGQMLRNYYNAVTPQVWTGGGVDIGFHLPVAPQIEITSSYPPSEVNLFTQVNLSLEIVGRRISYGDFTVDQVQPDGSAIRLSTERILTTVSVEGKLERYNQWRPGIQRSNYVWDVTLPVVSDGTNSFNELLTFTEDVAFLDGRYCDPGSCQPGSEAWNDVGLIFGINEDYTGGTVQRIVSHAPNTDALGVINIAEGAKFQAYSSVVTPDGRVVSQPGNTYTWPKDGLTWQWQPAPDGQYNLGFLITAFGGTTGFDSTQVVVNNQGIDPAIRGDVWLSLGLTLPRPTDWTRSAFSPDDFWVRTANADQTSNITVYLVRSADLAAIADGFAQSYNRLLVGTPVSTEVAGVPALEIYYTYQTETGTFQGRGLALYQESVGGGMVFGAETLVGNDLDPIFTLLRDHLVLIDLNVLRAADSSQWKLIASEDRTIEYPVRLDWLDGFQVGNWTRYAPGADQASPTFIAIKVAEAQSDSPRQELDRFLNSDAMAGTEEFSATYRTYYGQKHTWLAALYTANRQGQAVIGRMYVTLVDGVSHVLWVETLHSEDAATVFGDVFEPMVDGYIVTPATSS